MPVTLTGRYWPVSDHWLLVVNCPVGGGCPMVAVRPEADVDADAIGQPHFPLMLGRIASPMGHPEQQ